MKLEIWTAPKPRDSTIAQRVHIVNIKPFAIIESREFSRGSKSKFHADRSIIAVGVYYLYKRWSMKKRKRHPITLLEVMIVILLIGLIGGVLSYNLKGTLDRGKKFRTEEGKKRLKEILDIEVEQDSSTIKKIFGEAHFVLATSKPVETCVQRSGFIPQSNLNDFLRDGWKDPYIIVLKDNSIEVYSNKLDGDSVKAFSP